MRPFVSKCGLIADHFSSLRKHWLVTLWGGETTSVRQSFSSLSRQTDLWDIRCLIIIWINTRLLCENDMCTVHCSVLIVCSWWWRSSTDMNKPEQKPSAVSRLVDLAAHLSTSQVCQFSVLWQQWKLLKKWCFRRNCRIRRSSSIFTARIARICQGRLKV